MQSSNPAPGQGRSPRSRRRVVDLRTFASWTEALEAAGLRE